MIEKNFSEFNNHVANWQRLHNKEAVFIETKVLVRVWYFINGEGIVDARFTYDEPYYNSNITSEVTSIN